ncbi:hypothetical protein GWI33_013736 [Rhynchophorus ferrugineus]|uniref:Uncharacterized protein n=1 Tax=Rhynchophorus ferrugineus TaxID=354439 RepID=A0A834IPQ9_RHYFE|nr:hypothetical protein GWI33_013736 [Rhynchophorus ferrugineus]
MKVPEKKKQSPRDLRMQRILLQNTPRVYEYNRQSGNLETVQRHRWPKQSQIETNKRRELKLDYNPKSDYGIRPDRRTGGGAGSRSIMLEIPQESCGRSGGTGRERGSIAIINNTALARTNRHIFSITLPTENCVIHLCRLYLIRRSSFPFIIFQL